MDQYRDSFCDYDGRCCCWLDPFVGTTVSAEVNTVTAIFSGRVRIIRCFDRLKFTLLNLSEHTLEQVYELFH